jgi:DNA-binding MarR family transcriptional regulator
LAKVSPAKRTQPDPELGRLLRRASRSANRIYRLRAAELELTPRQAAVILALVESPGVSLGSLAETLGADQPTASALVDRLLAAGLVRRETDPDDRRRARLQPTESALQLAKGLAAARRESEALIRRALGPEDSEALARILTHLVATLGEKAAAEPNSPPSPSPSTERGTEGVRSFRGREGRP